MQNIPWQKIKALEEEIQALKNLNKKTSSKKGAGSLYGILKGVKISEKEFKEAKKAVFFHSVSHIK